MNISLVTTTINLPIFLKSFKPEFPSDCNVNVIIVGDNGTPETIECFCEELNKDSKTFYKVDYWSPELQDVYIRNYLGDIDKIRKVIPEKDIRRRNFGFLIALEEGADYIVSLDDDNYPTAGWEQYLLDFVTNHDKCTTDSTLGIINPTEFLDNNIRNPYIYSRGYPLRLWYKSNVYEDIPIKKKINPVMHQMLWSNKPDVDAITNLVYPELKTGEGMNFPFNKSIIAHKDNYFPIDTQSLIFSKELSIFHAIYQEPLYSLPSHRFDDIWAGIFCQKIANTLGDSYSFGFPIMEHKRNSHNFQKDLQMEFAGMILNTHMWDSVIDCDLTSKNYKDCFLELADKLPDFFKYYNNADVEVLMYGIRDSMRLWVDLLDKVGV